MKVDRHTVLLTGASSGIGAATAVELGRRGARLLLTGRDEPRLSAVAAPSGSTSYAVDLGIEDAPQRLAQWALENGPPDIVVHNAGTGLAAAAVDTDEQWVRDLLRVNLESPMSLTRLLLPPLLSAGGGQLVFVTSIAGRLGVAQESAYAASKAALHAYATSLRAELGTSRVRVTTFAPGVVDTEFFDRRGSSYDRSFPRPMSVRRVACALVDAIEREDVDVVLPRWLRLPVCLQAAAPRLYHRLASRLG